MLALASDERLKSGKNSEFDVVEYVPKDLIKGLHLAGVYNSDFEAFCYGVKCFHLHLLFRDNAGEYCAMVKCAPHGAHVSNTGAASKVDCEGTRDSQDWVERSMLINVAEVSQHPQHVVGPCCRMRCLVRLQLLDGCLCFGVEKLRASLEVSGVHSVHDRGLYRSSFTLAKSSTVTLAKSKQKVVKNAPEIVHDVADIKPPCIGHRLGINGDDVFSRLSVHCLDHGVGVGFLPPLDGQLQKLQSFFGAV